MSDQLIQRLLRNPLIVMDGQNITKAAAERIAELEDGNTALVRVSLSQQKQIEAAEAALERVRGLQRYDISPDGFGGITTTEHPTGDFVIALDLITALEGK